jgi:hypothetical protein
LNAELTIDTPDSSIHELLGLTPKPKLLPSTPGIQSRALVERQSRRAATHGESVRAVWEGEQDLCWHAVRPLNKLVFKFVIWANLVSRLAYCELYVTIAMLFHRFEKLKGNQLTPEDLVYDDYFASHHPIDATKFHIIEG